MTLCSGEKSLNQGFHAATLQVTGRLVLGITTPGRPGAAGVAVLLLPLLGLRLRLLLDPEARKAPRNTG